MTMLCITIHSLVQEMGRKVLQVYEVSICFVYAAR